MCFIHSVRHHVLCILLSASCNSVYCQSVIKVLVLEKKSSWRGFEEIFRQQFIGVDWQSPSMLLELKRSVRKSKTVAGAGY